MKPKKPTEKTSKLSFHKEQIRRLTADELAGVAGARNCTDDSCATHTLPPTTLGCMNTF
jgi:hypothetical protein